MPFGGELTAITEQVPGHLGQFARFVRLKRLLSKISVEAGGLVLHHLGPSVLGGVLPGEFGEPVIETVAGSHLIDQADIASAGGVDRQAVPGEPAGG